MGRAEMIRHALFRDRVQVDTGVVCKLSSHCLQLAVLDTAVTGTDSSGWSAAVASGPIAVPSKSVESWPGHLGLL